MEEAVQFSYYRNNIDKVEQNLKLVASVLCFTVAFTIHKLIYCWYWGFFVVVFLALLYWRTDNE